MADGARFGGAELVILEDAAAVAREAARRTIAALATAVNERHVAHIALTGGSTAPPLYRLLAAPENHQALDWSRVHLWWGDERFVPSDHPDSNAGMAYAQLLGGGEDEEGTLPIDPANVHPVPVEEALSDDDPVTLAAQRYAEELTRHVLLARGGVPRFDVLLAGVGPDGHVLSIFPNSPALKDDARIALAIAAPDHVEPHIARVTLSARSVAEAGIVLVMATGAGKAEILASVLGSERDVNRWPAQSALAPNAVWLLDREAAAQVRSSR
ncbi:MAG TPA: 6-phosphogluconolactonase [Candidatus Limnocylindria bacterium]|nr:6-phosphogluconolactonase [Candidatus Limnocylindria bacterium]